MTLNTNVNPGNINIKKVDPATKDTTKYETFTKEGNTYLLTDDIKGELGTTYILELIYKTGIETSNIASIQPFIYRTEGEGRWEVHKCGLSPIYSANSEPAEEEMLRNHEESRGQY